VFENSDYVRFVRLMSSGSRARKSDDPAMLPAIEHADRAALADSTWNAEKSITHDASRNIRAARKKLR
jgi:hypothetical protein